MINTVLIKAKGSNAVTLFIALTELYPNAVWKTPPMKWWQSQPRHELRIQNMPYDEIEGLEESLNRYWPLTSLVKVDVF